MHFSLKFSCLVASEMEVTFSDFRDFCMVGRWWTLRALTQPVCMQMENLRLWLQSSYIEVQ